MSDIDPDVQSLLTQLKSTDLSTRDDAIAAFFSVPTTKLTPALFRQLEDAYQKKPDGFLKAGLGRMIKLRKQAFGLT